MSGMFFWGHSVVVVMVSVYQHYISVCHGHFS